MGPVRVELVGRRRAAARALRRRRHAAPGGRRCRRRDRSCCRRAQRIPLGDRPVTVGRMSDCTIPLNDQNVSRHHAEITPGPRRLRGARPRLDERHDGQRHPHRRRAAPHRRRHRQLRVHLRPIRGVVARDRARHLARHMTDQALDILKLVLLGLLYLFFARVLWAVWSEVRSGQQPRRPAAPPSARRSDDGAATVAAPVPTTAAAPRPSGEGSRRHGRPARRHRAEGAARRGVPAGRRDHRRARPGVHDHDRRRHVRLQHRTCGSTTSTARRWSRTSARRTARSTTATASSAPACCTRATASRSATPCWRRSSGRACAGARRPTRVASGPTTRTTSSPSRNVFVVADGMGGHRAGEVASALAVDLLRARLSAPRRRPRAGRRRDRRGQRRHLPGRHRQPRPAGHGHDRHRARRHRRSPTSPTRVPPTPQPTPSTTASASSWRSSTSATPAPTCCATAGCAGSRSTTATCRSSWPTGHITDDEARTHPRRNIVTRALGIDPARARRRVDDAARPRRPLPAVQRRPRRRGARRRDRRRPARRVDDPQAAADELVALANAPGRARQHHGHRRRRARRRRAARRRREFDLEPAWDDAGDGARGRSTTRRPRPPTFDDLAALVERGRPATDAADRPSPTPSADHRRGRLPSDATGGTAAEASPAPRSSASSAGSVCSPCSSWRSSIARRLGPPRLLRRLRRRRRRRHLPRPQRRLPVVRSDGGRRSDVLNRDAARRAVDRRASSSEPRLRLPSGGRGLRRRAARRRPRRRPPRRPRRPSGHHHDRRRRPTTTADGAEPTPSGNAPTAAPPPDHGRRVADRPRPALDRAVARS